MSANEHPLLAARPPESDYLTYLTIIEYNLKGDDLPLLNDILQDESLTTNIGWDLVILLLPYLPASEECLFTIARLGNPREVLLKVTEALRIIDFTTDEDEDEDEDGARTQVSTNEPQLAKSDKTKPDDKARPEDQFCVLLAMLSILHRRLKAKYPSRFVATTLQAALAAFSQAEGGHAVMIDAVDKFIRGGLRSSSQQRPRSNDTVEASDPEGNADEPYGDENLIIDRLIQSFFTHITEAYMLAIYASGDVPGLGWSHYVFDFTMPTKRVPGRNFVNIRFKDDGERRDRDSCMRILIKLSSHLELTRSELLKGCLAKDITVSRSSEDEEAPPDSSEDVSLSQIGSLSLVVADLLDQMQIAQDNKESDKQVELPADLNIFPNQRKLIQNLVGTEEVGGLGTAGTESLCVIDAVLALGLVAINQNSVGEPESDEEFTQYLQLITLISANTPDPNFRGYAHFLASTVLRTHPSDLVRLAFIRDTLEHCPIENLKTSAVSWIKGETLEAFPAPAESNSEKVNSVFATPVALESLGPFLFPDLTQELGSNDLLEKWMVFRGNLSFYLAALNFYDLLLSAPHLREPLQVATLHSNHDIAGSMLGPLREVSSEFSKSINGGELSESEGEDGIEGAKSDLAILGDVLDRIEQGVIILDHDSTA